MHLIKSRGIIRQLWRSIPEFIKLSSCSTWPGRVAQSVGHRTRKSGVLGSIPGLATYFRFSFRFFKKGSCQLLTKVCARRGGRVVRWCWVNFQWLVGCFGFNSPLRQYFSLYRAASQREGERGKKG